MDVALRVERGNHAKRILNDELITEAFDVLEQAYLEMTLECDPSDDLGRYRYAEAVKVVRQVREHFRTVIDDGKMAHEELNRVNPA